MEDETEVYKVMNGNEKMNMNNYILFHAIQRGKNAQMKSSDRNLRTEIENHLFLYGFISDVFVSTGYLEVIKF